MAGRNHTRSEEAMRRHLQVIAQAIEASV